MTQLPQRDLAQDGDAQPSSAVGSNDPLARPMRILHCPFMVGGNPQGLAQAERELGLDSWAVSMFPSSFRYPADEVLNPDDVGLLEFERRRWALLARALRDFDVVHFNFGQSITQPRWSPPAGSGGGIGRLAYRIFGRAIELWDLPLLRHSGKGIVVTYQGDDARQGDYCRQHFPISSATEVEPGYYSPRDDARKRRQIAFFSRYADRTFALNPDLLHVLPQGAAFMPYAHVDFRDWAMVEKPEPEVPVVLHAPTHRGVKGTRYVLEAVSRLQAEGIPLEFLMVEGLTQPEARKLYERADLLVDQLVTGWYGGLAVELMALGKAVVCYLREGDLALLPEGMRRDLPIINATPATIYDVLKEWLTVRRAELPLRGRQSRAFAQHWHDPMRIAAELKAEYQIIVDRARSRTAR